MKKLERDFIELRDICVLIRIDYNTYNGLYFSGNDELLSKVAVRFFNDIANILQRDWLLQVCKIMDRSTIKIKGQQRENISINLINEHLEKRGIFTKDIKEISEQILSYGKLLKPARNTIFAHNDRETRIKNDLLGQTSEDELNHFLTNIQNYCDSVGTAIDVMPLDFTCTSGIGDVFDLLNVLKDKIKMS